MLKPIWFLIKLALLVYAVAWISERPGRVEVEWGGYLVEMHFGAFLAVLAVLTISAALIYRFWRSIVSVPKMVRRYNEIKGRERGFNAITKGLVAVAAGDAKAAEKHANRARKLVPDAPLSGLLMAQSAQMNGKDSIARLEFESLLEDKDAAFFGLRGLMNQAMKKNDHQKALELLRTAEGLHPKRGWIVHSLFDAEVQCRDWIRAEQTLTKAVRLGVFDRETGRQHAQAILVARADAALTQGLKPQALRLAKKAFRLDAGFIPASTLYARLLFKLGKKRKAVAVIEQAWPLGPHPDLAHLWDELAPEPKGKTDEARKTYQLQWYKRLYNLATYRPESNAMIGRAAMDLGMYAEAREWLKIACEYTLLAKLERLDGRYEIKSREWLERATHAKPKPKWVCENCGHTSSEWDVLCSSCHAFNEVEWRSPVLAAISPSQKELRATESSGFIEPPEN